MDNDTPPVPEITQADWAATPPAVRAVLVALLARIADLEARLTQHSGSTENAYQYTGQQYDEATGFYSLRARYYDPAAGRFLTRDTYPLDHHNPVELNRYMYTAGNPVNYADPSGYQAAEGVLTGKTLPDRAPPATNSKSRGGGGTMAEYAALLLVTLNLWVGADSVGRANHCMYLRVVSTLMAGAKMGPALVELSGSRPYREKCVIPVFAMTFAEAPTVALHIAWSQYTQGRPMLKTLERTGTEARRAKNTGRCPSPRPQLFGFIRTACDEYPYASTIQGDRATVMLVLESDNANHGRLLGREFYHGKYTNMWGEALNDGEYFASVMLATPISPLDLIRRLPWMFLR